MNVQSATLGIVLGTVLSTAALAESRAYTMPDFDAVSVSSGISVIVEIGPAQSITAEAPNAAILDRLNVDVQGGRLELGLKWNVFDWVFNIGANKGVVVHVSAPSVTAASSSSGADVDVNGMSGDALSLSASSGASMSAGAMSGSRVSVDVSSGASLTARGSCDQLIANASSGANLEARELVCADVDANASSGGHASVSATQSLDADASSGGGITVYGKALDVQVNSSSGGSISFAN